MIPTDRQVAINPREYGDKRLNGPPSLVIEIVSYSSKRTDRLQKRQLYQEEAVPDYWIVDIEVQRVERWRPGAEAPELLDRSMTWEPVAGVEPLTLDLPELFRRVELPSGGR